MAYPVGFPCKVPRRGLTNTATRAGNSGDVIPARDPFSQPVRCTLKLWCAVFITLSPCCIPQAWNIDPLSTPLFPLANIKVAILITLWTSSSSSCLIYKLHKSTSSSRCRHCCSWRGTVNYSVSVQIKQSYREDTHPSSLASRLLAFSNVTAF